MDRQFDLVIIGTGTAAASAAYPCRRAGWSVAVVDGRPYGGTCALRGCNPKKVLMGAAELVDRVRRMEGKGVAAPGAGIEWSALMRFKRTFTEPVPGHAEEGFRKAGIETLHGKARFTGAATLQVGEETLSARHVLIAAGSTPARLGFPGEELLTLSDGFLGLDELPRRIVFVGGGYVSFELAHIAARAGAEVTIVHRGGRPLSGFDPGLVDRLVEAGRAAGVEVVLDAPVEAVEGGPGRLVVRAKVRGGRRDFPADMAVHGAGRVAELEGLELEKAGVRYGKKGVEVDGFLRSVSNPAVYAAGDSAAGGRLPLTPVAGMEGAVAAANLLGEREPGGPRRRADYRGLPTVVFTIPVLAAVGLLDRAATEQGLDFRVRSGDSSGWFTSRRTGGAPAGYRILIGSRDDRILGAHLLGEHAEEVINLFAMAIRLGLRAGELKRMLWAYPTASYDLGYML